MNDYERGRLDERADVIKFMRDLEIMHRHTSATVNGEKLAGRHHARAMECCAYALESMSHMPHRVADDDWDKRLAIAKAWDATVQP